MARFEYVIKSDLKKELRVEQMHGVAFTADDAGNRITVEVTENGTPVNVGGTVTAYIIRADGTTVTESGSYSENRVWVDLPEAAYAVEGPIQIAIRNVSGSNKTVLGACTGYVHRSTTDTVISPNPIHDVTELLAMLDQIDEATQDARAVSGKITGLLDSSTVTWSQGGFSYVTGATNTGETRIRTGYLDSKYTYVEPDTTSMEVAAYAYQSDGTFIGWWDGVGTFGTGSSIAWLAGVDLARIKQLLEGEYDGFKVRIACRYADNTTAIVPSAGSHVKFYSLPSIVYAKTVNDTEAAAQGWTSFTDLPDNMIYRMGTSTALTNFGLPTAVTGNSTLIKVAAWVNGNYFLFGAGKIWFYSDGASSLGWRTVAFTGDIDAAVSRQAKFNEMRLVEYSDACKWTVGGFSSDGSAASRTDRIRSDTFFDNNTEYITIESGLKGSLLCYNRIGYASSSSEHQGSFLGWWDGEQIVASASGVDLFFGEIFLSRARNYIENEMTNPVKNPVFRLNVKYDDGRTMTSADYAKVHCYGPERWWQESTIGYFENWAIIGASYDAGSCYNDRTGNNGRIRSKSWARVLSRRVGNTLHDYANGGWGAPSFWKSHDYDWMQENCSEIEKPHTLYQLVQDAAETPSELYVITYGGNVQESQLSGETIEEKIGTAADIPSDASTTTEIGENFMHSFVGYYSMIIKKIMETAEHSKIIITTPESSTLNKTRTLTTTALEAIASHYNLPMMYWEDDPFMKSTLYMYEAMYDSNGNPATITTSVPHPTWPAYAGMSLAFERLFGKLFHQYPAYFSHNWFYGNESSGAL